MSQMQKFQFSVSGGMGQYAPLKEVDHIKQLEVGKFYLCHSFQMDDNGDMIPKVNFCHVIELSVPEVRGSTKMKLVKVVQFLEGHNDGEQSDRRNYTLSQLAGYGVCTFHGPFEFTAEAVNPLEELEEGSDE